MAKTKSSKPKQRAESHARRKVRKRASRGPIAQTAMAAGLAFSVSGVLEGCYQSNNNPDETVIDAGEDRTVFAILPPADAGRDSRVDRDATVTDAGEDSKVFAILPPIDSGADGMVTAILPPADAGKDVRDATVIEAGEDVTMVAILPPADAGRDSRIFPIMPIPIMPPSDSGFFGII
jgi:hypothetical protein